MGGIHLYTSIKTGKSVKRFEKAIKTAFLNSKNPKLSCLIRPAIEHNVTSAETKLLLLLNASANNELLFQLNEKVFFPAFYSGRISIKNDEVLAYIKDLKKSENQLQNWSELTLKTISSKYLTLMKKFGLMKGSVNKSIVHPYLSDESFILFVYWMVAVSDKPNLVENPWLQYFFSEKQIFLDRLLQKKFSKYFNVIYTGDNLSIEPIIPYENIYEHIHKS
jgi:hypothetical protein